jgi:hypothetical protein
LAVIILSLFVAGCGSSPPEQEGAVLTVAEEEQIVEWIDAATMYELNKIEGDSESITVWIDMEEAGIASAEDYANGLAERIAGLYDYEVTVTVTAMQSIEGSDKVRAFGSSLFTPAKGKAEYKPY